MRNVTGPATRTFTGVPKGYQGPGNNNGAIIYVDGSINWLSGTLQQNEQTTITTAGDIVIGPSAPNNLTIHAVLMAGSTDSSASSQIYVNNYNGGSPRGTATVLGGLIEKYYGPFGTVNGQGVQQTGYGRNFTYDTRMSRGFSPPYFPTTSQFVVNEGSQHLANIKPTWTEGTPP